MDSKVMVMTFSISSSVSFRGAPGRGSSSRPSTPCSRKRFLHLPTVCRLTRSLSATSLSDKPSAQPSAIRQRRARAWLVLGREVNRSNWDRSSRLNANRPGDPPTGGRPLRALSRKPSNPCFWNRERHWPTVCTATCSCEATAALLEPAEHARIIRALCRSFSPDVELAANLPSSRRSTSVNLSSLRGRPRAILPSNDGFAVRNNLYNYLDHLSSYF